MLFTLLIDDCQSETHRDLWDVYHSFYIDEKSHELICNHAAKLRDISKSIDSWNAKYGNYVRMVNIDTLESLHHIWKNYCDPVNSTTAFRTRVNLSVKEVYEEIKDCENPNLTRACGARCLDLAELDPSEDYLRAAIAIWKPAVDALPNPLFVYSQGGGSRFCVDCGQCPYYGFHLVTSLSAISPQSPFYLDCRGKGVVDLVKKAARKQFSLWCAAFCRLIRESIQESTNGDLRIRVFVGDPLAFVDSLKRRSTGGDAGSIYSRPYSSRSLSLIDDFNGPEHAPLGFHVIDTGYLVDSVGILNILPGVTRLLKRVKDGVSIVYTSIEINDIDEENDLLKRMLCGDVGVMCTLLGIVPIHYLSPHTPRFYHVDNPTNDRTRHVTNRISWKLVASDCPKRKDHATVTIAQFDEKELAEFFKDVYFTMFYHEYFGDRSVKLGKIEGRPVLYTMPVYTRRTFACLLQYVKGRIDFSTDEWGTFVEILIKKIKKRIIKTHHGETIDDFILQMVLGGVLTGNPDGILREHQIRLFSPYRDDRGVLKRQIPPEIIALVITIPRTTLKRIYNVIATRVNDGLSISFEVNRVSDSRRAVTSLQLIFGKLVPSQDGQTGTIQEDKDGWHGSSDLQICAYIMTVFALVDDPRNARISVRLSPEASTLEVFESMFGPRLEIFNRPLFDHDCVHFFESLPGLKPPISSYSLQTHNGHGTYAIENESFKAKHPRFLLGDSRFSLIVNCLDRNQPGPRSEINVTQDSPCTAVLSYNGKTQSCTFPFPVVDVRCEQFPTAGVIIINASLLTPSNPGVYNTAPFRIIRLFQTQLANWNYPYINFRQLPKIDTTTENLDWVDSHLTFMFSERELTVTRCDEISFLKSSIRSLLNSFVKILLTSSQPVRLTSQTGSPLYFFPTGLYHDLNSASIVFDAYVLRGTANIPSIEIRITDRQMSAWQAVLPPMIERCRNWEHTRTREYLNSSPLFCSCGMGITEEDFSWKRYQALVTRIAISPIFATAYVDRTRSLSEEALNRLNLDREGKCKVCFKEGAKKCSRCMNVAYCSKECQAKDWKEHKKTCKPKLAG